MRCQTDCCLHWRANMHVCECTVHRACSAAAAAASQDWLSISIGVTASNCHANALQSFHFVPLEFAIFLNPFSLILFDSGPWISLSDCISLFQIDTDKMNMWAQFSHSISVSVRNQHSPYSHVCERIQVRVNAHEWKCGYKKMVKKCTYCNALVLTPNGLWKFLAHYRNESCQRPIWYIRPISPN